MSPAPKIWNKGFVVVVVIAAVECT